MHKHLGVIFSSDCKWTKHIDVLIEKTSKHMPQKFGIIVDKQIVIVQKKFK